MQTKKFTVTGMTCAACQVTVERALSSVKGVESAAVSLMTNSANVEFDDSVTEEQLKKAVSNAGYTLSDLKTRTQLEKEESDRYKSMLHRLIPSAVLTVVMMYVTMGHMVGLPLPDFISPHGNGAAPIIYACVQLALAIPVIIINRAFFIDGFKAPLHGSSNMNTLVGTGAAASMIYGIYILIRMIIDLNRGEMIHQYSEQLYFESVNTILTLILLGRTLESRARRHTSDAVRKLMELTPKEAEVIRGGRTIVVKSEELRLGDRVIIRSGAFIPCDGKIVSGGGAADESVITGESVPVEKSEGDSLICGTILVSGYAEIEASQVGEDTTVAKIVQLVENAASGKAPIQKLADKISAVFVPVVCSIALVTFVIWLICTGDLHRAIGFGISVVVISCPCALGLATPTAVMCGVGRGATFGILIKSADAIDTLHHTSVVVMDKTGTITEGKMKVSDVITFGTSENELLSCAASLEQMSEHPIGVGIVEYAGSKVNDIPKAGEFSQTFGGGVSGVIDGEKWLGGNLKFISESGVIPGDEVVTELEKLAEGGKTPIIFAKNGKVAGIIALRDTVKESSVKAVANFHNLGYETVMLTGDCEAAANAIARECEIDRVISGAKPDDKAKCVESIMSGEYYGDNKRRYVIMIGDGVNDAPSLAMADCGMAVARGTDIAIESAGVVLVKSDLTDAAKAVALANAIMKNIRENLIWAFGYNVLCIPVAAGVLYPLFRIALTPMIASAAMSLSSICVVSNALRLKRWKYVN